MTLAYAIENLFRPNILHSKTITHTLHLLSKIVTCCKIQAKYPPAIYYIYISYCLWKQSVMLFFIILLVHECFTIKVPLRIYGGIDAKPKEYPYAVRIEVRTSRNFTSSTVTANHRHSCTASALTPVWLITAAHCLTKKYPIIEKKEGKTGLSYTVEKLVIRYGPVESSPWAEDSFSDVLQTVMHPRYMDMEDGRGYVRSSRNDIGLLKTSPIRIGSYVKISAVDYKTINGQEAIMGGFGYMTKTDANGTLMIIDTLTLMKPLQLLKVVLTKCRGNQVVVPTLCLCPSCEVRSSGCPGDSGGPVMHPSGLVGVIAAGSTDCKHGRISLVFDAGYATPVSPYIEWIYSYVNT